MNALSSAASFGLFLRIATARFPPVRSGQSAVNGQIGEDLLPVVGEIAVDDRGGDQTGIDHFEQVVVFQALRSDLDDDRWLALRLQPAINASRLA